MARPSNTEERRAQIVEGLLAVMSERGYERASIAEIGRACGLTSGLLHYHFASKQEILIGLIDRLQGIFDERLQERMSRAGEDSRKRLHAFVDAHLARDKSADPRAVAAWVVIGAEAIRQPEVRELYRRATEVRFALLHQLILERLRATGGPVREARQMSAAVLAAIEGAFQLSAAAPGLMPEGSAAPTVRRMVDGLFGRG